MKSIIVNLAVENCEEALGYYKGIFGGEIKNTQKADGVEMFKGHEGKYIHAELHINESCVLFLTDIFNPEHVAGNNFQLVLEFESEEEITNAYEALSKDGKVGFPLGDTFWGAKHGVVTDKFGITWGLNYTK
ncbi:MAG TPA: VOC family protein [Chondromyces sp.]|nr:VOC family protein [Chondromyces sp.]